MKHKISLTIITILLLLTLSGCLYPKSELSQNQIPSESQIAMVQMAVDQYQEQTQGLLPIKTMSGDTPIFEKYIIDFNTLKQNNLISELPGNSFERGGYFVYALTYVETDPTVKLIDVRTSQKLQEINRKLHSYMQQNTYLPIRKQITGKYFEIDFVKLGYTEEQYVLSPYSNQQLPIIIDNRGSLYVDYRVDLHQAIEKYDYDEYEDVRYVLVDHNLFLPVYSPNYVIQDEIPLLAEDE